MIFKIMARRVKSWSSLDSKDRLARLGKPAVNKFAGQITTEPDCQMRS